MNYRSHPGDVVTRTAMATKHYVLSPYDHRVRAMRATFVTLLKTQLIAVESGRNNPEIIKA